MYTPLTDLSLTDVTTSDVFMKPQGTYVCACMCVVVCGTYKSQSLISVITTHLQVDSYQGQGGGNVFMQYSGPFDDMYRDNM